MTTTQKAKDLYNEFYYKEIIDSKARHIVAWKSATTCAKKIGDACPYIDKSDRSTIAEFRASDEDFQNFWDGVIEEILKIKITD